MNQSIFVSVIMNCHNSEKYLKDAINSVYKQTYINWEIIFLDNYSTDKSYKITQAYDKKLKYFKTEKYEPLYKARNIALEKCSGDLICFLDCDDVWFEDKLERQVNEHKSGNLFTFGGSKLVDVNFNKLEKQNLLINKKKKVTTNELIFRNFISIGCVAVDSKLIKSIKFDPYYELLGDFDLWIRLSIICNPINIPFYLEYSRQHDENISKKFKDLWIVERRYFYKKFLSRFSPFSYPSIIKYIFYAEMKGIFKRS